MNGTKCLWLRQNFYLIIAPSVVPVLPPGKTGLAAEAAGENHRSPSTHNYKLLKHLLQNRIEGPKNNHPRPPFTD